MPLRNIKKEKGTRFLVAVNIITALKIPRKKRTRGMASSLQHCLQQGNACILEVFWSKEHGRIRELALLIITAHLQRIDFLSSKINNFWGKEFTRHADYFASNQEKT